MKHSYRGRLGLLFSLGLAVFGQAQATSLTELHVDDMAAMADTVIVGRVLDADTIRTGGGIDTVYTLRVDDAVTGQPGASVSVLIPGGSAVSNGIRIGEVNAGAPMFDIDWPVVLFLTRADTDGRRQVLGYTQGQFAVDGEGMVHVADLGQTISLEAFKARIQAHAD